MENNEFMELGMEEMNLDEMEEVTGGKKRMFVRALDKGVAVRSGPGSNYSVIARLGYGDEVLVVGKKIYKDKNGLRWAKVTVGVSQKKFVEGWVSSKHCDAVWYK